MTAESLIRRTLWTPAVLVVGLMAASGPALAQDAPAVAQPLGRPVLIEPVTVPFDYVDGRILVPVTVEGVGEVTFILDTAAGGSVVSERLREVLDPGPEELMQDSVIGASGARLMEYVRLPGLALGGQRHEEVWAVVADLSGHREHREVEGILGVNVLADYDVEIDVAKRVLRLHAPDGTILAGLDPAAAIPFHSEAQAGFVQFTASVAGQPAEAVLDTGARRTIVNWHAAGLAGVSRDSEGLTVREGGSRGLDGHSVESHKHWIEDLAVGATTLPARDTRIADLPVFRALGIDEGPVILVGNDLLEICAIRIAYSAGLFHVCPDGPPAD